jgi:hypothetical protein
LIAAVPERAVFSVLVAVTVAVPLVAGAVKRPLALIAPMLTVQLTAEL